MEIVRSAVMTLIAMRTLFKRSVTKKTLHAVSVSQIRSVKLSILILSAIWEMEPARSIVRLIMLMLSVLMLPKAANVESDLPVKIRCAVHQAYSVFIIPP